MSQRTRGWLVVLLIGGLLALPTAAIAQSDANTTDAVSVSDHPTDLDELKHRALHAIERRLKTVARLAHLVERSHTVTEEHAAKLLRDLRDAAEGLEELARKIKAAETVEELRELIPLIFTEFRIYQLVKPKVLQVLTSDKVSYVARRLAHLADRLEMLIKRAHEAGYDVEKPRIILARMRANVKAAAELGGPVADMVIDLQPPDWPDPAKELLEQGRRRLRAAFEHLKTAKYQARKIIRWLRNLADPPIDLAELG